MIQLAGKASFIVGAVSGAVSGAERDSTDAIARAVAGIMLINADLVKPEETISLKSASGGVAEGGGRIVNSGSVSSSRVTARLSSYTGFKHAVKRPTRSAKGECVGRTTSLHDVCSSFVNASMVDYDLESAFEAVMVAGFFIGRVPQPKNNAKACVSILSDECAHLPGKCMTIDGAYTIY